ncbi:MAG: hypothetical protein GYA17_13440, partial [Chloroflexi bacterium]|nr:hypothetical protein [Chloroflexota bacterium]
MKASIKTYVMIALCLALAACQPGAMGESELVQSLIESFNTLTPTPFQPIPPTQVHTWPAKTGLPLAGMEDTATPAAQAALPGVWLAEALPPALRQKVTLGAGLEPNASSQDAMLHLEVSQQYPAAWWVYALVAPFPTIADETSTTELTRFWRGEGQGLMAGHPLYMSAETRAAFTALWGEPASGSVETRADGQLLDTAWANQPAWAIVPFEDLSPRWKVLRVDNQSPVEKDFDEGQYALRVPFGLREGNAAGLVDLPATNREADKMTVVLMTGVTALVRATGAKMEQLGMTYPGQDIRDWMVGADITHVSNEVSFDPRCPDANPYQDNLMFCSKPEYIQLLEDVGVDVVEMTGNHLMDWRYDAILNTFDMYQQQGMEYFGSGETLEAARQPLLMEHNGNRLAFIGCNPAGPETDWATDTRAGTASCDYEWMKAEISRLRDEGYLPIVTLQYFETYVFKPSEIQRRDYPPLAEAGAVIVSGSQAHFPQAMQFDGDHFIHYGLGNLFFDQMDIPVVGTRREFLDRHVFYDGRYISTQLLTAMLEDYAR